MTWGSNLSLSSSNEERAEESNANDVSKSRLAVFQQLLLKSV